MDKHLNQRNIETTIIRKGTENTCY